MNNTLKMFGHISKYSKEKQIKILDAITNFLWDSDLNPEEFLDMFANAKEENKQKWMAKILTHTDWFDVIDIFGFDIAKKYATNKEVISMMFPESQQKLWKDMKEILEKYYE